MRYAVEIARQGSISRASQSLLVAQPNLSRCMRELEEELGVTLFDRNSKGMQPTPRGAEFIDKATKILRQIDDLKQGLDEDAAARQSFSLTSPRSYYVTHAFTMLSKYVNASCAEIFYNETTSAQVVQNVLQNNYRLGIIRVEDGRQEYTLRSLEERGLRYEPVASFQYMLVMSKNSPLADCDAVDERDLPRYIEISHANPVNSSMLQTVRKDNFSNDIRRHIYVVDRATQMNMLAANPLTFMVVSAYSPQALEEGGLVQRPCTGLTTKYHDYLIRQSKYMFTDIDKAFADCLKKSVNLCFYGRTI